jgi:hypothetical protein
MRLSQVCAVGVVCLAASAAGAQDSGPFLAGTYYRCDMSKESRADEIYKEAVAPAVQKQIEAGTLIGSGYARHWMGGEWRRLEYIVASSIPGLVKARQAIIAEMTEGSGAALGKEFDSICPGHDDYIWTAVASSQDTAAVGRDRTKVAMSTYFVCGSHEDEADAIVKTAFAPAMNAHVKEGKIASWNWVRHVAGGQYRRLLVIDGADHASLLGYWNVFAQALDEAQPELSRRFNEICPSHTDYVWDMGVE